MNEVAEAIKNNIVFREMTKNSLGKLQEGSITKKYKKGEFIVLDGEVWPYLFIVASGSVQVIKCSNEGRNLVVTTFGQGEIFWGLAFFFRQMPMMVTLQAAEDLKLIVWSEEFLVPLLKKEGATAWELSKVMISKMTRASEILEEMTFQPVASRLAKLLMDTSKQDRDKPISRDLTLDEMAARIGSTREMVCRFLHRFAKDGVIDITRTEFQVNDIKKLEQIASNIKG